MGKSVHSSRGPSIRKGAPLNKHNQFIDIAALDTKETFLALIAMPIVAVLLLLVSFGIEKCVGFGGQIYPRQRRNDIGVERVINPTRRWQSRRLEPIYDSWFLSDEYKEKSRSFRRTVFTKNDWERHRSSKRFRRNLVTMFQSGVMRGLLSSFKHHFSPCLT